MDIVVSSVHDDIYNSLIKLLGELKLVLGPEGLSATIRRHKLVRDFLVTYQQDALNSIESTIADLDK